MDPQRLKEKEAQFHDVWAASERPENIRVHEAFEAPAAMENREILRRMGDLRGKRVLDVGAGLGESSVYFALRGARVTCTDVSPGMVEFAQQLAKFHGVKIDVAVCAADQLHTVGDDFDFAYIANTLHHVPDRKAVLRSVHKSLKPGGRFFSWDPIAYNPVINVYRRMATQVRTEDESPLTFKDVHAVREIFVDAGHREFWISTLSLFLKYYLIDRVHPNDDRYWKRILRETPRTLWWWMPLKATDTLLSRIPLVRRLAWNMVMWGTREA